MSNQRRTKIVKEGQFIAEVEVAMIEDPPGWEPYLSVEDAEKLDQVRAALKAADTKTASRLAKVYRVVPVSAA